VFPQVGYPLGGPRDVGQLRGHPGQLGHQLQIAAGGVFLDVDQDPRVEKPGREQPNPTRAASVKGRILPWKWIRGLL
jgi:hypothetical protein